MQIVHIIAGSGGSFYCQNCVKDTALITKQREMGHDVIVVPLYLPAFPDDPTIANDTPTFFGAINLYLQHQFFWWSKLPSFIHKIFDSPFMLKLIAPFSGPTRAEGLEEMTIAMLNNTFEESTRKLINWMTSELKPDIIHISNALLLGFAKELKSKTTAKVICSLQDEDHWVETMRDQYKQQVWDLIGERAQYVDHFIAVSNYYADKVTTVTGISRDKISTVHAGIDPSEFILSSLPDSPPVIGYLSRCAEGLGLDIVVDAFIRLKNRPEHNILKLAICGGMTHADCAFMKTIKTTLSEAGVADDVTFVDGHELEARRAFLKKITVLSVPPDQADSIGVYLLEAFAAAVPVIQPDKGGYSEVLELSGGGLLYDTNDAEHLEAALDTLLSDHDLLLKKSRAAREAAESIFNLTTSAHEIETIYKKVMHDNATDI